MDHQRQYEEFQPSTEWVQDRGHQTLIVYLPGFRKEQLKVQVTSARNMRISGERPLGNHKWSRFCEECAIPSDCDINAISARFEGGMLYVRLPKKISPEAPREVEEAKPTTEAPKEPAKKTQQETKGQEPPTTDHPQPQPKPVASPTRKEDKQKDEKVNGNAKASDVSQKEEEKKAVIENIKEKSSSEAEKKKEKSEDRLDEAGKLASTISGKVQPGKLKKTATDLAMGLKRPKALLNLALGILLAVVFILYVTNAFKSLGMPKNTTDSLK